MRACTCRSPAIGFCCSPIHRCSRSPAICPRGRAELPVTPGNYRINVEHGRSRAFRKRWSTSPGSARYYLLVGRDNKLFAPLERRFWYGLAAAIAVLSIAGLLVGLITRRALMSRVHSIRQTVSAIIHGDLKHRLPTHLSDDELNTLARTINGMLDQIELLVHGVRNVSNSIAHDLRTPLAELRSRLEELALDAALARERHSRRSTAPSRTSTASSAFSTRCCGWRKSMRACAARDSCRSIWPTWRQPPWSSMRRRRNSRTSHSPFMRTGRCPCRATRSCSRRPSAT